jgi:hypothetical protein
VKVVPAKAALAQADQAQGSLGPKGADKAAQSP